MRRLWIVMLATAALGCGSRSDRTAAAQAASPVDSAATDAATLPTARLERAFPAVTFDRPLVVVSPGDGSDRLFVVEQPGRISILADSAAERATPFLDLTGAVDNSSNEMGLLGLAFSPDYRTNGRFYVDYTAGNPRRTVIARYTVRRDDPNRADPGSKQVLLEIAQPYGNHNGGCIAFGPDGNLYVAMGDGGSGGDPHGNGQNTGVLLGKILRLDVDRAPTGKPYSIPADNPFASGGGRPEIFAYGLRNPWRFSFDPATGQLWAGDVGQNRIEEVDLVERGGNYGWNVMEGRDRYESSSQPTAGLTAPVAQYDHSAGQSITAGVVYRGSRIADLVGRYLYADFVSGRLWSLKPNGQRPATPSVLLESGLNISSFGTDRRGEVLVCAFDGRLYRLVPGR